MVRAQPGYFLSRRAGGHGGGQFGNHAHPLHARPSTHRLKCMADPIGIDFGGSGIKAAPVDLTTGEFSAERERIDTPEESSPKAVAKVMATLLERFEDSHSAVGVTIPGVVRKNGVVASAANIDKGWIGTDADDLLSEELDREVH